MIEYVALYFVAISLVAAIVTIYDKKAAKHLPQKRIPEKVLLLLALFGGAAAEYLTMKKIRHKTKKNLFMLGLPLIFLLHLILVFTYIHIYYF